jgi:chromate reductase
MTQPNLLGICGALRAGSMNRKLLLEAAAAFGPATFTEADLDLPLYNGDDEDAHGIPAAVQTLFDQIAAADAVIIATPEYNKAPPGVLKNALDWVSRIKGNPWKGKPVAIMSAADGRAGGERAQVILRAMLHPFRPRLLNGPEIAVAGSTSEFDENGRLTGALYAKNLGILMRDLRAELVDWDHG